MAADSEPHVPVGRLVDGTPVFAAPGRMTVVDGRRRVVCHACGARLSHIASAHLARHGLTLAGYRQRYGLPPRAALTAPGTAAVKAAEGRTRYGINTGVHTGLAAGRARTAADADAARLARVAELGFPGDLPAYLRDRYVHRQWGVRTIAGEVGASHRTVRRLLDDVGLPRRRPGWPTRPQAGARA